VEVLKLCSVEWQSDGQCWSERDVTCTGRGLFQHVLVCPWRCGVLPRKLSFTAGNLRDEKLNRKPHNVQKNASHYKRFIDCAANWGNRNCVGCQPCRVGNFAVRVSVRSFSWKSLSVNSLIVGLKFADVTTSILRFPASGSSNNSQSMVGPREWCCLYYGPVLYWLEFKMLV